MKLYITGSVGSGKSTLARQLSGRTGIPCWNLDEVVYEEDPASEWGNKKRPVEERDARFAQILARDSWIMEDAGRECFREGMRRANAVVLLEPPLWVRKKRIAARWLKQNLGLEKCIYRPRPEMLKFMFLWLDNYERGKDGVKARLAEFKDKTVVLRRGRELRDYLDRLAGPGKPRED